MRILLFLHCGINFGALSEESLKIEHKSQIIRFFVCLNLANMLQVLELFDSNIPLHQQHCTWHSEWYDEAWATKSRPFLNIIFSKLQCVWVGGVVTLRMRSTEECQLHHIPTIRTSLETQQRTSLEHYSSVSTWHSGSLLRTHSSKLFCFHTSSTWSLDLANTLKMIIIHQKILQIKKIYTITRLTLRFAR